VFLILALSSPVLSLAAPPAATPAAAPVAGLQPDRRPAQAPQIKQVDSEAVRKAGLRGVSEPIPASLGFLANQGAWYTPFTHPGMTGPYDLRGWHATPAASQR
jgi:hypothetical protein